MHLKMSCDMLSISTRNLPQINVPMFLPLKRFNYLMCLLFIGIVKLPKAPNINQVEAEVTELLNIGIMFKKFLKIKLRCPKNSQQSLSSKGEEDMKRKASVGKQVLQQKQPWLRDSGCKGPR